MMLRVPNRRNWWKGHTCHDGKHMNPKDHKMKMFMLMIFLQMFQDELSYIRVFRGHWMFLTVYTKHGFIFDFVNVFGGPQKQYPQILISIS